MKNTFRQITAGTFIALLLLVGNVKADGTEIKTASLKVAETTLQLENWMTNKIIWNNNTTSIMDIIQETETNMELENWMTNDETWNVNNSFVNEAESGLELESWMTNDETWNLKDMDVEQTLTVENWMINDNIWQ